MEDSALKTQIKAILKAKKISGSWTFEELKQILTGLETTDLSAEKKMKWVVGFCFFSIVCAIVLFFAELPIFAGLALTLAIALLIIYFVIKRSDLDNDFRNFVKPVVEFLGDDLKPGTPVPVEIELLPPTDKKFKKGKSPKYSKGIYHKCIDHYYERDAAILNFRLFDGNRLMLHVKDHITRTVKTKKTPSNKYKIKVRYKKLVTHNIQLRLNPARFRCKPLPPEVGISHNSKIEDHHCGKEKITHSSSEKGDTLNMVYSMKSKAIDLKDRSLNVEPAIVPHQVIKLYSFLEPLNDENAVPKEKEINHG